MKKQTLAAIVLFLFGAKADISAEIKDHLKKIDNKLGSHSIKNIDFIYMINLDQRPEKLEKSLKQLEPFGIYPFRVSAVNGWELDFNTIDDLGVKFEPWMPQNFMASTFLPDGSRICEFMSDTTRTYFYNDMSRGALGCFLSHLSILQDAYDSGYETIWVMEDDILVLKNPNQISELIDIMDAAVGKQSWDILFTDKDSRNRWNQYIVSRNYFRRPNWEPENPNGANWKKIINKNLRAIGARFGSYSMILRRSGIKKILDFVEKYKIFVPYDDEWQNISDLKMFSVLDDLITTIYDAPSDNSSPKYDKD